jgi:hypothetical protein
MSENRTGRRAFGGKAPWWLWVSSLLVLGVALALGLVAVRAPVLIRRPFIEEKPLDVPQVAYDADRRAEILEVLEIAGKAKLSADSATQLLRPWHDPRIGVFALAITPDSALRLDLSVNSGVHWVNVHFVGRVEMEKGRFTRLLPRELVVSGWDLDLADGEDLSQLANERLGALCAKDPRLAQDLARVGRLELREGHVWVYLPDWP